MKLKLACVLVGLSILFACFGRPSAAPAPAAAAYPYPFDDPRLPLGQRVNDLVGRLTLEEKVSQMVSSAPAIPRLGIPAYEWWHEALHGVVEAGPSTVFPQAIGLAAAWDAPLHHRIATAISDEARAKYDHAVEQGQYSTRYGLDFWAPNINIVRDPRWGRGQETYGEDPYLTAALGVAFVSGMQGPDPRHPKVIATPKHFAVHSGPEPLRHRFNAVVSPYDLNDTYLRAFRACVTRAHAQSVMGAYSALYGIPDCASPLLLQRELRQKWGFDGYVVSDCGAIGDIAYGHHYAPTVEAAAAAAVKAGCDLDCGGEYQSLAQAVRGGLISEAAIDRAVGRLFTARMKLGMFDPFGSGPYDRIPFSVNNSPAHRQIALRAARESLVLLKNAGGLLPLSPRVRSIALIGPNANDAEVLLGNYHGTPTHAVTLLEGLRRRGGRVRIEYVKGCTLTPGADLEPVPSAALRSGGRPGLTGEYFSNQELQGAPLVRRKDRTVELQWEETSPVPGLPAQHVSARWTGELIPPRTGTYTLAVRGDDGFRLWVDGRKVIDDWSEHPPETRSATVPLAAGRAVPLRLEFFQAAGGAEVALLWKPPGGNAFGEAVAAARRSDVVVFAGGISAALEGEEGTNGSGDRADLSLPAVEQQLLHALVATDKPVILVLMSGSALSANWATAHLSAILQAWYPGEEGGDAVADALFGSYNPAGRLPVTFYRSAAQLPPFTDYAMKGRTYRYFDGQPLYPFGFGLSYTRFAYRHLRVARTPDDGMKVTAEVANIGPRTGDEVVELYLRPAPGESRRLIAPDQPMPRLELAGFRRVPLQSRQRATVSFRLAPEDLRLFNARGERALQPVKWQVFLGGGQPDLHGGQRPPNGLTQFFTVESPSGS